MRDKFKPYALPTTAEMRTILSKLRSGWPKA
jgi:hypothetical protein